MKPKRVLIVDDEKSIRDVFARAFNAAGYSTRAAADASSAVELMEQEPAQVLFLDLNLPGTNGLELCRTIRKRWPWAIAIAVTGYASLFELLDCREAGFEDYFLKPVPLQDLFGVAEQAFKKIERWQTRPSAV